VFLNISSTVKSDKINELLLQVDFLQFRKHCFFQDVGSILLASFGSMLEQSNTSNSIRVGGRKGNGIEKRALICSGAGSGASIAHFYTVFLRVRSEGEMKHILLSTLSFSSNNGLL
jgi:hypothetical protein